MSKNKRLYSRWHLITEKDKLIKQCKTVISMFSNVNYAIKSVADNAFLNSRDN